MDYYGVVPLLPWLFVCFLSRVKALSSLENDAIAKFSGISFYQKQAEQVSHVITSKYFKPIL